MKNNIRRKIFAFVITAILSVSLLAGCSSKNNTQDSAGVSEDGSAPKETSASDLEPVTLTFWSCGDKYTAQDEVLAGFCEKYKSQLNIDKIEYNFVSFGDYEDKMTALVAGGDNFDGFYVSDWMLYAKMANKGALLPLNDLMEQYAPSLLKTYKENGSTTACSIDGKLVALPWTKKKSSKPVLLYRKDLAEQYGVDTSKLVTIEDLDRMFTEAKAKVPDITIFESGFPRGNTYSDVLAILHSKYGLDAMNYHMLTTDLNSDTVKIQPIEQTDMFKEAVTWMQKWYNEGIVSKNELSETDTQLFENGKTFAKVGLMENALQGVSFNISGADYGYAEIYPEGKFRYDSPLNNAFAINKNAANPERVLMLMELLNTNEEAYDMFMYGIEGKTYVINKDGAIDYPEGQDSSNSTYLDWFRWPFIRSQFNKPSGNITTEALEAEDKWLQKDSFAVSPLVGFNPDTSNIKTEMSQRDQLYDEQGKLLLAGIIDGGDVNTAIDNYIQVQKNSGLDAILSYIQTKADLFMAGAK
ncbi:MAG: extracellular solute-binding protein [Anaerocolumna sp.]